MRANGANGVKIGHDSLKEELGERQELTNPKRERGRALHGVRDSELFDL